jgi:hypothetical protein
MARDMNSLRNYLKYNDLEAAIIQQKNSYETIVYIIHELGP